MNKQKGFSLIELLIVVAIILVITAIAIPAAISATQASNEASAASTLKALVTAENAYRNLYPSIGYSSTAAKLGNGGGSSTCPNIPDSAGDGACLLADGVATRLDAGTLSGYTFTYAGSADGYTLKAVPSSSSKGRKSYIADQSGTIAYAWGLVAPTTVAAGTILGQ